MAARIPGDGDKSIKLSATGDNYEGTPNKDKHQGMKYQCLLLMLYAVRAHRLNYKFNLATEIRDLEKFDDIMFRWSKDGKSDTGGRLYQVVQVKYSSIEDKKITALQLLDRKTGAFSLRTYFKSYIKLISKEALIGCRDDVDSVIICTNQEFDYGTQFRNFKLSEEIMDDAGKHDILPGKVLKLMKDFIGRNEIVDCLNMQETRRESSDSNEEDVRVQIPDIEGFLSKLRFAVKQPGIDDMERIIKKNIAKCLCVKNACNAYTRLLDSMWKWLESSEPRFLTDEDIKGFICGIKVEFFGPIPKIGSNLGEPVHNFTGRSKELKDIHNTLHKDSKKYIRRTLVICGLGGVGKTELVRKYAKNGLEADYHCVAWLDAEMSETLETSLYTLTQRLGIKNTDEDGRSKVLDVKVNEVYDYFVNKTLLIVLDNAELTGHVKHFLKIGRKENVYVLVTSRSRDGWSPYSILPLKNFSLKDAVEFIGNEIGSTSNYGVDMAKHLARKLSNFPLALKQAVSFIKHENEVLRSTDGSFSIYDYLSLFENKATNVLDNPLPREIQNDYINTTYSTMNVAMSYVNESENARFLLNIMSYMSPDNIDMKLLGSYLSYHRKFEVGPALEVLSNVSIVSIDGNRSSIHRLVQMINRGMLRKTGQEEKVLEDCIQLLDCMDVEQRVAVFESVSKFENLFCKYKNVALNITRDLFYKGMSDSFGKNVLHVFEKYLGSDCIEVWNIRKILAICFYKYDNYGGREADLTKIIRLETKIFGENDPCTLHTMLKCGEILYLLDRKEEAVEVYREVLRMGKSIPEVDPELLSEANIEIDRIYQSTPGMVQESKAYFNESSEYENMGNKILKLLKVEQISTNGADEKSDLDQIQSRQSETLEEHRKILLETHLTIAFCCGVDNYRIESLKHYKRALSISSQLYGNEHIRTRVILIDVAEALFKLDEYEEAIKHLEKELEYQIKSGYTAIETELWTKALLIRALAGLGRFDELVKYAVEYCITDKLSMSNTLDHLVHQRNVFNDLLVFEQYEKIVEIVKLCFSSVDTFKIKEYKFVGVAEWLVVRIARRGRTKESFHVVDQTYDILKSLFGVSHEMTLKWEYFHRFITCLNVIISDFDKGWNDLHDLLESLLKETLRDNRSDLTGLLKGLTGWIAEHSENEYDLKRCRNIYKKVTESLGDKQHQFGNRFKDIVEKRLRSFNEIEVEQ